MMMIMIKYNGTSYEQRNNNRYTPKARISPTPFLAGYPPTRPKTGHQPSLANSQRSIQAKNSICTPQRYSSQTPSI